MNQVALIGASVRALAESAKRAGLSFDAFDLFADLDLQKVASSKDSVTHLDASDYPHGFVDRLLTLPSEIPLIYTGGLENAPDVIEQIAKLRPIWGNPPDVLRQVRDPYRVSNVCQINSILMPEMKPDPAGLPIDGSWLVKSRRSAGGKGIHFWQGNHTVTTENYYWQKRISGQACSAVYCRVPWMNEAVTLWGISEQLIGIDFLHGKPFGYCGNILRIDWMNNVDLWNALHHIGETIGNEFKLIGLFGIDFVLDEQNQPWLIEINPRYTASMELYEVYAGISLLKEHIGAIEPKRILNLSARGSSIPVFGNHYICKAIYYALRDVQINDRVPWNLSNSHDHWQLPTFADTPRCNEAIQSGSPIVTLLVQGENRESCLSEIRKQSGLLDELFMLA